ncbi:MAG: Magnesium and cobalt efflux protein CorC [Candidatus Ozemobacter sibiricus]|jgi:putative hemolysin|uniref:Magnesium and cobalt efflux protein CorC n=1 Tax=Candidatus Ozemobacter sibiricus TaxID=2268124 RepID=A0A367ZPA7_9BACT|nr:MAG: Magnesium and cobalt efflux protein CorC [Candidatus Ozemobacter sibiricus]
METAFHTLVFLFLLCCSAFLSASETAFFSLSPLRLRKQEDEGDAAATEILGVLADKQTLLTTVLLGNTFVNVAATAMATHFLLDRLPGLAGDPAGGWLASPQAAVAVASVVMTVILLLCGEITPKVVALYNAPGFARLAVKPIRLLMFLLSPVTRVVLWIVRLIFPASADLNQKLGSATSLEEIDSYFSLGEEVGIIERDEKEMISSVFEFGDTLVREVMVPRPDIMAVPITMGLDELLKFFREDGHSRFPVYDGSLDKVVGIVYVKDLLVRLDEVRAGFQLASLLRPPYFVPETKKLDDLLREFQKRKLHMALVVDEFGGVSGLVTIEDLLEEIVGEIVDEYDGDEQAPLAPLGENTWSVDARFSLRDLETELGIKLDYEDSETVGGYVLERLGRIPKRDERVEDPQALFQVTEIKGNRILRVKVVRRAPPPPAAEADGVE